MQNSRHELFIRRLGLIIKELRTNQSITQETLSAMCDVDVRTIQRIEKGQQNITMKILFSIADALNIEPDKLVKYSIEEGNTIGLDKA